MPRSSSRPRSTRTTGLLAAVAMALIIAGVVLIVALGNRGRGGQPAIPDKTIDLGAAPDITELVKSEQARVQSVDKDDPTRVMSELLWKKLDPIGGGFYSLTQPRAWIYMKDGRSLYVRADTGKVKMPTTQQPPESGIFSGNVVCMLFSPVHTEPGQAPKPWDPEVDVPGLMARTSTISFDTVLLELSTKDPVTISTPSVEFDGVGLQVRGNQVKDRIEYLKVTEGHYIRYNPGEKSEREGEGETVAAAKAPGTQPRGNPGRPRKPVGERTVADASARQPEREPAAAPATVSKASQPAKEDLYRAVFSDDITVTQLGRRLKADTLQVWARLIDNKLPENAFGEVGHKSAESRGTTPGGASNGPRSANAMRPKRRDSESSRIIPAAFQAPGPPATLYIEGNRDVRMTWTGPLVLTPLAQDATPPELDGGNHFALRFTADKPGGQATVAMSDEQTHARGECAVLDYAATTRNLTLSNGPDLEKVWAFAPESGALIVPRVTVNVGTGDAHIPGGGMLASLRSGTKAAVADGDASAIERISVGASALAEGLTREITWNDQATLKFRTEKGQITDALEEAAFTGHVAARDQRSSLTGDFLKAKFVQTPRQASSLSHLTVDGNVVALADRSRPAPPGGPDAAGVKDLGDGTLRAEHLDVDFKPSRSAPEDVDPVRAIAVGSAEASRKDAWLRADRIETALARDEKNNVVATDMNATSKVRFVRTDGISAEADMVVANAQSQFADLTGRHAFVRRLNSTIVGTQIHLEGLHRSMLVHGAGSFEHMQPPEPGTTDPNAEPGRVLATWTRSMSFDDLSGRLECDGDTVVTSSTPLSLDTVRAFRVHLDLTPGSEADELVKPTSGSGNAETEVAMGGRRVLRAEALGSILEREDGSNAKIESRKYTAGAAAGSPRVLQQVMYLEGQKVLADDVKGTMDVPTAGMALVLDQRAEENKPSEGPAPVNAAPAPGGLAMNSSPRGTSRFTWTGTMHYDRATGVIDMHKDVELIHKPLAQAGGPPTRLVCETLLATLGAGDDTAAAPSNSSKATRLIRADASGAVYAESGPQRLVCDWFIYDAENGKAEATASTDNRVTFYDDRRAAPLVARKLRWDLARDRIEITEPSPIVAPR